jgi:hypothetical protein
MDQVGFARSQVHLHLPKLSVNISLVTLKIPYKNISLSANEWFLFYLQKQYRQQNEDTNFLGVKKMTNSIKA